jgi:hypothetical protein
MNMVTTQTPLGKKGSVYDTTKGYSATLLLVLQLE